MEFGPRALGARSIIGDPRNPNMQKHMNLKIKYRESFRPFAPIVLAEEAQDWFESGEESPYMLLTTSLHRDKRIETGEKQDNLFGIDKLNVVRSKIPAVTHVNNSARIQTVDRARNAFTYELLKSFQKKTGCPVLINTSFNIRGEPIVCTPLDALRCFMNTEIDYLFFEWFLIDKKKQKGQLKDVHFKKQQELD
jgi:carbamoyltransferase